jgi:L-asparaginase II
MASRNSGKKINKTDISDGIRFLSMPKSPYQPVYELTRGDTVESIHYGAIAVVSAAGELVAWYGDPNAVTFLRSTAKPLQALPFIEHGGPQHFGLTRREIAILCASHSGTDEHVRVVQGVQEKCGLTEAELLCGVHDPEDPEALRTLRERNQQPTPNRHNCSGKHTGMLAHVCMCYQPPANEAVDLAYIDPNHPLQKEITRTFAEMCALPVDQVAIGIDGCSAPNFAVPLRSAALAIARMCDPEMGGVTPPARAAACKTIITAMMAHPDMVAGPGRFDTCLMQAAPEKVVSKGGAEAYHGLGLLPAVLGPGSPALGIALKISDGDQRRQVRVAVVLEVLRQLGVLTTKDLEALSLFGPTKPLTNWRGVLTGRAYPAFTLEWAK